MADEHPRRYLARALFDAFAVQALAPDSDLPVIGDAPMILMTPDEAGASEYAQLYRAAANDKDGIAIRQFGDHYAAVSVRKEMVAILPQFGQRISTYALFLVSVAVLAVLTTIIVIYLLIRRLTLPFDVLTQGSTRWRKGTWSSVSTWIRPSANIVRWRPGSTRWWQNCKGSTKAAAICCWQFRMKS